MMKYRRDEAAQEGMSVPPAIKKPEPMKHEMTLDFDKEALYAAIAGAIRQALATQKPVQVNLPEQPARRLVPWEVDIIQDEEGRPKKLLLTPKVEE